uniref:Uncharacterized protein n=1 Tax=viral metagenome TaxID=1070528 RepID=A0A6C0KTY5_9ZZZZ
MTEICYIRRKGQAWVEGKEHHSIALATYRKEEGEPEEDCCIAVPHCQGGFFVAYFSKINDNVFHFRDEYDNEVDIMMSTPATVAHINRITD